MSTHVALHVDGERRPLLPKTSRSSSRQRTLLSSQSSSAGALSAYGSVRTLTRSLRSSSRGLMRSLSNLLGAMEETFYCQICFENVAVSEAFKLTTCGHPFCRACLEQYLDSKISDAQLYPVCFHEDVVSIQTIDQAVDGDAVAVGSSTVKKVCGVVIPQDDICAVVSVPTWRKYQTFLFNKTHQHARQCPYCDHSQDYPDGQEDPACTCEACGKTFCFHHSNAHVDSTCAEHEKRMAESERLDRAAISKIAKDCPGCGHPVEKNGGCNHMTCVSCGTDFCWLCGAIVDKAVFPEHFQWWNVAGCPGAQMTETDDETLRMLYVLVLGVPTYILAAVLTILSWPFPAFRRVVEGNFRAGISLWLQLLMTFYVAVVGIVFSPIIALVIYWDAYVAMITSYAEALYSCLVDTTTLTCPVCNTDEPIERQNLCVRGKCSTCLTECCWNCGTFFVDKSTDGHFKLWHRDGCVEDTADDEDDSVIFFWFINTTLWILYVVCLVPVLVLTFLLWPWNACRSPFDHRMEEMFYWIMNKFMGFLFMLVLFFMSALNVAMELAKSPYYGIAFVYDLIKSWYFPTEIEWEEPEPEGEDEGHDEGGSQAVDGQDGQEDEDGELQSAIEEGLKSPEDADNGKHDDSTSTTTFYA